VQLSRLVLVTLGAAGALPGSLEPSAIAYVQLPGGPPVGMDYLAYDAAHARLWIPAGNTGRIDVLDTRGGELDVISQVPVAGRGDRTLGASSATVGDGEVYVGNRADSTVCTFDAASLERRGCVSLTAAPDGLSYVSTTREVWVTLPGARSLAVLDVTHPGAPDLVATVLLEGRPEGYAVDTQRGVFYSNLEDLDRTLAIDVRTRRVLSKWNPGCGEAGPRGLAIDESRHHLFVACTDRLKTLALTNGAVLSEIPTGEGVDNIDFLPNGRLLYAASGREARLTVAAVDDAGALKVASTSATAEGCRTVVVDDAGVAYLPDARRGRIVVVRPR
jgi:DNA-binding beta-propeller fold protein YncE